MYRAEIEFVARSIDEFEKIVASLVELPITVRVREWPIGHTIAGCWPIPIDHLRLPIFEKIVKNKPKIVIRPLPGGIRIPHLHVMDKVVLVDRKEFKQVIGEVAKELAGKLSEKAEYIETVGAIRNLVPGAK